MAAKRHSALPDFDGKPTFGGIQLSDTEEDTPSSRSATSEDEIKIKRRARQTTLLPIKRPKPTPPAGEPKQTRAGRIVKPMPKAKEKTTSPPDTNDTEALVTLLAKLLDNDWEKDHTSNDQENIPNTGLDPLHILAISLHKANTTDPGDFVSTTYLDVEEPETYERAMSYSYAQQWAHAIQEEVDQLEKNKTWELVPMSEVKAEHKPLSGKWVFKVKRDVNGDIAQFKARWVVQGYLQQYGVDFDQTYAAIMKPMAFRVLFAIAAYYDFDIDQMDVKTAFLYGLIDQLVYVQIPKGSETSANKNMVCKLLKALYGLKQAPRLWYKRLSNFLFEKLGLQRINADHSIFVSPADINGSIVSTFVDDIKIMRAKNSGVIAQIKQELTAAFEMADMGPISFYLGLKVS